MNIKKVGESSTGINLLKPDRPGLLPKSLIDELSKKISQNGEKSIQDERPSVVEKRPRPKIPPKPTIYDTVRPQIAEKRHTLCISHVYDIPEGTSFIKLSKNKSFTNGYNTISSTRHLHRMPIIEDDEEKYLNVNYFQNLGINDQNLIIRHNSIDLVDGVKKSQLQNIVFELLSTEKDYIRNLERGIMDYVEIMKNDKDLPVSLRGHKYLIFSEIEEICAFHRDEFYPALKAAATDIRRILEAFRKCIDEKKFYVYVLYIMNKNKSNKLVEDFRDFFEKRKLEVVDQLGVQSFLMTPLQRLPKYELLLLEILKELMKPEFRSDELSKTLAACCTTHRLIGGLIEVADESIALNEIVYPPKTQPLMIHDYGCFLKSETFDIREKRKYRGKLFLFERLLIVVEVSTSNKTSFRTSYRANLVGIARDEQKSKDRFVLFETERGNNTIEISNSSAGIVDDWVKRIEDMKSETTNSLGLECDKPSTGDRISR